MPEDLNRRNTETVVAQVRMLDLKVRDQEIIIKQLIGALAVMDERMRQAEAALMAHRITNLGAGPTVKGE